ncbi:patatin-like protein [Limnofasciculus baicalensis]|uniref:Patatin-like protein n=1 Tax=Limnofasciculus baicalensis BBK-W-15 TaxID=2699891 RepID=A0AAE3GTX1_9CYAN|nr:patatin-like protein [Limnofasciculus baicalensis]MCP2730269.1 patatin-like protein [Limnofasciculus baicalensis BBK-W-15]
MSSQTLKKPEFSREYRLGLVVYGGVSLAIYMNGISREFYNAVRGRGIYKLIKALTDSDIVVDIISGTSAGGINGVLLSYALANSNEEEVFDFQEFDQVWRESGSINKLMYEPAPQESQKDSVLDGEGYYQNELVEALKKVGNYPKKAPAGEWFSQFNELDLFVTGTDVLGRIYQVFDDTGRAIELKNHRTVFNLKHCKNRQEPFKPTGDPADISRTPEVTYQSLAKLCRITSCFPVVFPVVTVGLKEDANEVDKRLISWGNLEKRELPEQRPPDGYQLHFLDGGILDNRPFSYAIKDIYYRTANRPVNRKIFYIDPCPDRFMGSPRFNTMPKPNVLDVIQEVVIGLPTYESISNDLESIQDHNNQISRYNDLLTDLEKREILTPKNFDRINSEEEIYLKSRLIILRDRILPLILRTDSGGNTKSGKSKIEILEQTAQLLIEGLSFNEDEEYQVDILEKIRKEIDNLDVYLALRKHFYIVKKVLGLIDKESDLGEYKKLKLLASGLNSHIKLLEVIATTLDILLSHIQVSESFEKLLEENPPDNDIENRIKLRTQVCDRIFRLHRFFLDADGFADFAPDKSHRGNLTEITADFFKQLPIQVEFKLQTEQREWLPQKEIDSISELFKQKISNLDKDSSLINDIWEEERFEERGKECFTVLDYINQTSEILIKSSGVKKAEHIWSRFKNFRNLDRTLYPFEYLTSLKEKNHIELIRFSPDDAQRGLGKGKTFNDKLAGDTLATFGGFFKKSWRSNDILWGRLDGLNRIVEALVNRESVQNFPRFLKRQVKEQGCTEEEYIDLLVEESFLDAQSRDREKIKTHLHKLADPTWQGDLDLNLIVDDLVLEGHRSILMTDIQNTIEDEISEQISWNQQRLQPTDPTDVTRLLTKLEEQPPNYQPVPGYFQESVTILASGALAKQAMNSFSSQEKENFFRKRYRVGKESVVKDIPVIVLSAITARFVLVMRDIIITVLGEKQAAKIKGLITYQFFNKSVQLFYWWLQQRGPIAVQNRNFPGKRPLVLVLQVLLLLTTIIAIIITAYKSPWTVTVAISAIVLFWLLGYTVPGKR